jgi:predicted  nucleic acid-binding Zn-ribbon protein
MDTDMDDQELKKTIQDLKADIASFNQRLDAVDVRLQAMSKRQDDLAIAINQARDDIIDKLGEKIHDEVTATAGEISAKVDMVFTELARLKYQYNIHEHPAA